MDAPVNSGPPLAITNTVEAHLHQSAEEGGSRPLARYHGLDQAHRRSEQRVLPKTAL